MSARREAWQRIQAEAPEFAAFLSEAREAFGTITLVEASIDGEPVWPPEESDDDD